MNNKIGSVIDKILENKAQVRGVCTPKEKVINLIDKLHPYQTDKELIRIGPNADGGYLVPNDLDGIKACFSPGVDRISEFELECYKRGMAIYLADKSVDKPNLNIPSDQYDFIKKFIGCTNNIDYITMDEWVNSKLPNNDSDLLLQMDIEGAEFYSLINISDTLLRKFRILVIEFHFSQDIWNHNYFKLVETVFEKILQSHTCVHIHPNNCSGLMDKFGIEFPRVAEFSFLRNDRINHKNYQKDFPHPLDVDNTEAPHLQLPKNWYMS